MKNEEIKALETLLNAVKKGDKGLKSSLNLSEKIAIDNATATLEKMLNDPNTAEPSEAETDKCLAFFNKFIGVNAYENKNGVSVEFGEELNDLALTLSKGEIIARAKMWDDLKGDRL